MGQPSSTLNRTAWGKEQRRTTRIVRVVWLCLLALGLTTGLNAEELMLAWQDNSDNEFGFEVERSLDGSSFEVVATLDADVKAFSDTNVTPGLNYFYRVRAFNEFGFSGYTNVSVATLPNTAPVVTSLGKISILKGETIAPISISYNDAETSVSELQVELSSSNGQLLPLGGLSLDVIDGEGTLSLSPKSGAIGSSTVSLLVSDGVEIVESSFILEVLDNTSPVVSSMQSKEVSDGALVGPFGFSINDEQTDPSLLTVSAMSLDESKVDSSSIEILGTGTERSIRFRTQTGKTGKVTLRVAVSDGVYVSYATLQADIISNWAPVLSGISEGYTLPAGQTLSGVGVSLSDRETVAGNLIVSVKSSNELLVPKSAVRLKGTGENRTLEVVPAERLSGTAEVEVLVSDGVHTTTHQFTVHVLPPEVEVKIKEFSVIQGHAVAEVENIPDVTFKLWKTHSLVGGAWELIEDAEVQVEGDSVYLIDPSVVDQAICYQVTAE